jgi:cell shape-determining protein MreC
VEDVGEFENIVTTFQYNLALPVVVLLFTLVMMVVYHPLAMLVLIALFVYMLFALLDLVNLISRYALQRGEFVKQQVEQSLEKENKGEEKPDKRLTKEELNRLRELLTELEQNKER